MYSSALFNLREKFTSEFIRACLNPLTVHFPMAGMFGWTGVEVDAEEDGGCLTGGGEGSPRRLGVRGVDRVSRRPLVEDGGSMMLTVGEGSFLGTAG